MPDASRDQSAFRSALEIIPHETFARCAQIVFALSAVYAVLWLLGFQKLFLTDSEGLSALVQIIGTLYSVLYAFATYVIWGQFTSVENEILKESGTLKDLLLFSGPLKEITREPVVRSVKSYARAVVDSEWRALAAGETGEKTDRLFRDVIESVTSLKVEGDSERVVYERLLDIANQASVHRDERLSVSLKRMPRTLFLFVSVTACTILLLLLFYPFRNLGLGIVAIAITSALLFFAHFVLSDLDNPFQGTWNVSSDAFEELIRKYR
ncbi:MAG: hypothetical protein WB817_05430 [Terriglobales bacterium]